LNSIPATGSWALATWYGLPGASGARLVEQQQQIPTRQARKPRRWMDFKLEAEHIGIEGNSRIDVINNVPNIHSVHLFLLSTSWQRTKLKVTPRTSFLAA
jgi:hypothetical protein